MEPGDPTYILFTKIRTLEPENAPKIIGYLLLQDLDKRDLTRLAHGPDSHLQSFCMKAKSDLGLSSNASSTSQPLSPISRPINIHRQSFATSSLRMCGDGFLEFPRNTSLTSASLNSDPHSSTGPFHTGSPLLDSSSVADCAGDAGGSGDILDDHQLGDYLSFLNDSSSTTEEVADSSGTHLHRRSFSANDACFGSESGGYGDKGIGGYGNKGIGGFGPPNKIDHVHHQPEEFMRMKAAHQQRTASCQFMAADISPMPCDKGVNFLLNPRNAHRSWPGQVGKEGYWYGRDDFMAMGIGDKLNSAARQIYLTFSADSTFKDEDVSTYFSNFGPVQEVRIPHQQKRLFGFVKFVHAEPRQQQIKRGKFSPSSIPSGIDSRDPFDCHLGPRMFRNTQETIGRQAKQADPQQALELQRRRLMNLQLPDLKNEFIHHHHHHLSLSVGSPVYFPSSINQNVLQSENVCEEVTKDNNDTTKKHLQADTEKVFLKDTNHDRSKEHETCNLNKGQETSLEDTPPDTLFASPTKSK